MGRIGLAGLLVLHAGFAMAAETVITLEGGIAATFNLPDGATLAPAVLMLHGFGSSRDEVGGMYAREAAALATEGVASLRIDFRGFGDSDGDTSATTVQAQLADAAMALAALAGMEGIDPDRIGVLGFSMGGGVAMLLAAERPGQVKALGTWSSVGDFHADFVGSLGQPAFDEAAANGRVDLDLGWRTITLQSGFFDSLSGHNLLLAVAGYPGAYLSLSGENDFASAYAEKFSAASRDPDKMVLTSPGADHIFGVLGTDQSLADFIIEMTARWFANRL